MSLAASEMEEIKRLFTASQGQRATMVVPEGGDAMETNAPGSQPTSSQGSATRQSRPVTGLSECIRASESNLMYHRHRKYGWDADGNRPCR